MGLSHKATWPGQTSAGGHKTQVYLFYRTILGGWNGTLGINLAIHVAHILHEY